MMSNVVDFLEQIGRDVHLRYATEAELELALRQAGIAPDVRSALLDADRERLEALLGASANVCCMVHPPGEEEEEEEDDTDDTEEDGDDEEEELEKPPLRRSAPRRS
jgi:hypothetical protein